MTSACRDGTRLHARAQVENALDGTVGGITVADDDEQEEAAVAEALAKALGTDVKL